MLAHDASRFICPPVYQLRPLAVSPDFRAAVQAAYPLLADGSHRDDLAYRRIMQYLLTSTFTDSEGRLILPHATVAKLAGVSTKTRGFAAEDWIERFSCDVLPLNVYDYCHLSGQARTVAPDIPSELRAALVADGEQNDGHERVFFDTGDIVSRRVERAARAEHERWLSEQSRASVDEDHPAHSLIDYLLRQPQDCLQRVLNRNWPAVSELVHNLPTDTERERMARDWCQRLMLHLEEARWLYYAASPKTPRVSAIGPNVHQLPRTLRRAAFAGAYECDLRAAQLAVVARLWDIPDLQTFLEAQQKGGGTIWQELLGWISRPISNKPIIKKTIYSVVFGMGRARLLTQLAEGDGDTVGVGQDAAERFFSHPLVTELLSARARARKRVWDESGTADAWGNWIATTWDRATGTKDVPSVLAYVVQSWELRLMLSVLPVIESEEQIYLLSWLHDGITVWLGNRTKADRQVRKLQAAVRREADTLGLATCLEVEQLTANR
jgi:hypothetical protein